jgi:DNA (cytosine-5)-methyltransferase 1
MKKINQLDLFSGIGGFHLGFEKAGYKVNSYFSEIDKHAIAVYKHKFKNSKYVGSVTDVRGEDLPKIDLITFGSPCQDFSLAGKRQGMGGDRSSLVLEAIRLIRECRPRVFIWENVKGTFSSNSGEDFAAIIQAFTNIGGYRLEWQLLNTSWFLPQNRERIYLVGYSTKTKRNWRGVFPIREETGEPSKIKQTASLTGGQLVRVLDPSGIGYSLSACDYKDPMKVEIKQVGTKLDSNGGTQPYQQDRVYDEEGIAPALNKGKSDLILKVKSATLRGYEEATEGDSINLSNPDSETRRGRVGKGKAQTLDTASNQAVAQPNYTYTKVNETIEKNPNSFKEGEVMALDFYNQSVRNESPCLTDPKHNNIGVFNGYRIRRLTPIECERLQGFPDNHTEYGNYDGEVKNMSNTQRYKQCGNAVTVDVAQAVAERCKDLFNG